MDKSNLILLKKDNFTSLKRTPWAGNNISLLYKKEFKQKHPCIGESWELSCSSVLPSLIAGTEAVFVEWLKKNKPEISINILTKIIDTTDMLSLQVHPCDEYSGLSIDECGKPESWYILEHFENSGIYLGFKDGITFADIKQVLKSDKRQNIEEYFHFHKVKKGDFFDIPAGTPHALGAGLTVYEPQWVSASKRPITYRMWDWGRYYDAAGAKVSPPLGNARELHIEQSISVLKTSPNLNGVELLEKCTINPILRSNEEVEHTVFAANNFYIMHTLKNNASKSRRVQLVIDTEYVALSLLTGRMECDSMGSKTEFTQGQSAVLFAGEFELEVEENSFVILVSVVSNKLLVNI